VEEPDEEAGEEGDGVSQHARQGKAATADGRRAGLTALTDSSESAFVERTKAALGAVSPIARVRVPPPSSNVSPPASSIHPRRRGAPCRRETNSLRQIRFRTLSYP
jgi:hypothetical protein